MQIREVKGRVQLIRSEYVPAVKEIIDGKDGKQYTVTKKGTGRNKTKTVGTFSSVSPTLSDEVRLELKEDELEQVEKWIADRQERDRINQLKFSPEYLPGRLQELAQGIDLSGITQEQVDQMLNAVDEFKAAVRGCGLKIKKAADRQ